MEANHQWEDLSYHGSPDYYCRFCNCYIRSKEADQPCPKALERLKEEQLRKEEDEWWEYKKLKAQHDRYEYLKDKYEDM